MEESVVQLYGRPERIEHLRRELEKKGFEVKVVERDQENIQAQYHSEIMRGLEEIRMLLFGINP